jgi:hypothetical protein
MGGLFSEILNFGNPYDGRYDLCLLNIHSLHFHYAICKVECNLSNSAFCVDFHGQEDQWEANVSRFQSSAAIFYRCYLDRGPISGLMLVLC